MKKRALVVEDSPTQGEKFCYDLERHGYETRLELNGKLALAALASCSPDVVLTDILMPEMDGYELCRALKSDDTWKTVPVILVTRLSDPVEVVRALECGADGFVVKPYSSKNLVDRLGSILSEVPETEAERASEEMELNFQGETFRIAASRRQILNVLLSTYEMAVDQNGELHTAQEQLRGLNESLEEKVRQRTTKLLEEVGERRRAEERLIELNEALEARAGQLQRLAMDLTRTEQAERERLAGVLHDHLQQVLVGAKMMVGTQKKERDPEKLRGSLARVEESLGEAVTLSRDLTVELCPPVLREGGLAAALEWLGQGVKQKNGIEVKLDLVGDSDADACAEEITVFLFQAARELLFNIVKHAGVREAEMSLAREEGLVRLIVRDRGKGFDLDAYAGNGGQSFGLFSLVERAEAIQGNVKIMSSPGGGTEVSLAVPCNPVKKHSPAPEEGMVKR